MPPASINPFGILYRLALRSLRLQSRQASVIAANTVDLTAYPVSMVTLESKRLAMGDKTTLRHSSSEKVHFLRKFFVLFCLFITRLANITDR